MSFHFGDFELDGDRRELRLAGREIPLQPRVFDLLAYLIRHRDRVVSKDELLDALWPAVIVTEGSLQRAVSLARSALKQGGAEAAIRTYARAGYRFCAESAPTPGAGVEPAGVEVRPPLDQARTAWAQAEWSAATEAFRNVDHQGAGLLAIDLERWAEALLGAGRGGEAIPVLERAAAAHAAGGDDRGSARCAIQLAQAHLERREPAAGRGWLQRARRLLGDDPAPSREAGLFAWTASRYAAFLGDLDEGRRQGERAFEIGRQRNDPDLEALGLLYAGLALQAQGDLERGCGMQDEAAAMVLAGGVSPWAGGMVYCGVIWGCLNRADYPRAGEWTEHFSRWCERSGQGNFPGLCRLHRAEVLSVRGELVEAEREVLEAQGVLGENAPWAEGDAFRVLGEIRFARGDLAGAERAFHRAHALGWEPQPGLAMLQVAQGRAEAAVRGLQRALADQGWFNQQRRGLLLAQLVIVAAAAGQLTLAHGALAELNSSPGLASTPVIAAAVAKAEGELAWREGRLSDAVAALRQGLQLGQVVGAPLHVAGCRLRLAQLLMAEGDPDAAELELQTAEAIFQRIGAAALTRECSELRRTLGMHRGVVR